jgi:ArsR family transcriptional regulator, arsenate/arsenite/antimonite-responsive transcriptional repressor / arsenate reductase (thioredoxin)
MGTTSGEQHQPLLALLAERGGWNLVNLLARSDYHFGELKEQTALTADTLEHYLQVLREYGLISERPSDAQPDEVFYRLDLDAMRDAFAAAGAAIHPVIGGGEDVDTTELAQKKPRVLFLCTGNSARSQIAEGLMRHFSKGNVAVFSAGSKPSQVHPLAIKTMNDAGIDISNQRSKHLDEFVGQQFDYVITVCDHQHEACPVFPGNPDRIHWGFSDPVNIEGEEEQEHAFRSTANHLRNLVRHFLILIERKNSSA